MTETITETLPRDPLHDIALGIVLAICGAVTFSKIVMGKTEGFLPEQWMS